MFHFGTLTSGLFTDIILKSYAGDSRLGPTNALVVQENTANSVRYEFGVCLYLGYTFGFVEMVLGIVSIFSNPFPREKKDAQEVEYDEKYLRNSYDTYY